MTLRRFFALILIFALLALPVHAATDAKYVALTFDDGPSGRYTAALLEGLAQRNVRATFFLCGYRLATYTDLAKEIRSHGHEVGLHGYSHDSMAAMSRQQIEKELTETAKLLPREYFLNLMRPPGGQLTEQVRQAAEAQNLAIIQWSVDPRDWATTSAALVEQRVLEQVHDGAVILMHDMSDSSVEAALALVDQLKAQGYHFLTVSQLALLRLCQLRPGQQYTSFS